MTSPCYKLFIKARSDLGEILSSCEFIDAGSMECVNENLGLDCPIGSHPFYLLIETSGSNMYHDQEKVNQFLERVLSEKLVTDGTVASSNTQAINIHFPQSPFADVIFID